MSSKRRLNIASLSFRSPSAFSVYEVARRPLTICSNKPTIDSQCPFGVGVCNVGRGKLNSVDPRAGTQRPVSNGHMVQCFSCTQKYTHHRDNLTIGHVCRELCLEGKQFRRRLLRDVFRHRAVRRFEVERRFAMARYDSGTAVCGMVLCWRREAPWKPAR